MSRRAWLIVLGAIALAVLALVVVYARGTITALILAVAIAYVCEPWVDALERRRVPRSAGILMIWSAIAAVGLVLIVWIVPRMIDQSRQFLAEQLDPDAIRRRVEPLLGPYAGTPAELLIALREKLLAFLQKGGTEWIAPVFRTLGSVTAGVFRVVMRVFEGVLIPVMAFYLLRDSHRLKARFTELIPPARRKRVLGLLAEIDVVLRRFLWGQLIVSSILGALYALGMLLLGTPLAIPVGILAGFANLVPYGGFVVGLSTGLLLSFLQYGSWVRLLLTVGVFALVQALEGTVISPRILGESTGLHPVVVLLALMIFGSLFGFLGLLAAVPATAAIAVLMRAYFRELRKDWA